MDKFVFFGRSNFQYNGFDSMKILLNDVISNDNFFYVEPTDSTAYRWLNFFYLDRIGTAIKKRISVPLRTKAFQLYVQHFNNLSKEDEIYFIFVRHEPWFFGEDGFFSFLRKQFPKSKLVYLLINVNRYLGIDFDEFCPYFDRVLTIDEGDAEKYGLEFHPFFYSPIEQEDESIMESDCFFVGNAKERLSEILEAYELLTSNGLKCDFHIVGVPEDQQKYKGKIEYNTPLDYDKVVFHVKRTKILLEIMQEGQTSGTLREHEAVIYGKKLLTNNQYVTSRNFYHPENISIFDKIGNISLEFIASKDLIAEYPGKDQISPRALLDYLVGRE